MSTHGFSTRLIHAGEGAAPAAPVVTPIYETSTFVFDDAAAVRRYNDGGGGYLYSRYENPTVLAVEQKLAAADGAEQALVFASGMAATSTLLLSLLSAGDEVVCGVVYGGTFRLLERVLPRLGIATRFATTEEMREPERLFSDRTRLCWFESPVNPHLRCVDVAGIAAACRRRGVTSVVDNTFASAVNQPVLAMGVDLSMQSATKYLNGHSDVVAGVVSGARALVQRVEEGRRAFGGILDPQPAYALGRSLKTLALRVARHNANALAVAQALDGHPALARVYYPGLASHPDHDLARRQMRGFGGMVCLDLAGGEDAACRAFDRLRLIGRAASLGGVESICSLPVLTSHAGYSDEQLAHAGVSRGMMRLSIGLEEPEDLIADLRQALA